MVVKRHNGGLIEIYSSGEIKFRPHKFTRALGEEGASEYRGALEKLVPEVMGMHYPKLTVGPAEKAAPGLFDLIRRTLERVEEANG